LIANAQVNKASNAENIVLKIHLLVFTMEKLKIRNIFKILLYVEMIMSLFLKLILLFGKKKFAIITYRYTLNVVKKK